MADLTDVRRAESPRGERVAPSGPKIEGGSSAGFHIPSLDGIRAVAIVIVFLSHAGWSREIPGVFGVTIFFFLSGYLITTLLRMEFTRHGSINFGQFYLRRTLRIFPPLYAYLLLALVLAWVRLIPRPEGGAFLAEALYGTNLYLMHHPTGGLLAGSVILWSLAIEEHFYLIFPVLFAVISGTISKRWMQALMLLGGCALVLAWRFWLVHVLPGGTAHAMAARELRIDHGTDTRFDSLLFGCALALWGNPALDGAIWPEWILKGLILPIAGAVLLFTLLYRSDAFRDTFRFTLQGLALVPFFMAAVLYPKWLPFRALNWRAVRFLGVISYTVYLVHLTAIIVTEQFIHKRIAAALTAAGATLLWATASYYFLELPCARLRKRFSRVNKTGSSGTTHGS